MTPFQEEVLAKLKEEGSLYLVGGAIRDEYFGIPIKDLDILINMSIDNLARLLQSWGYVPHVIGSHHQTVSIFNDGTRIDFIEFSGKLENDSLRRDFTINAIYKNLATGELLDPLNGFRDLESKTLRTCGPADLIFKEDPVRILRMVRFAIKYSFRIEPDTWKAAQTSLSALSEVAMERVTEELSRILILDDIEHAVRMLDDLGYWREYIPELAKLKGLVQNKYHSKDAWEHTLHVVRNTPNKLLIRLAALFHDLGKWETASKECKVWGQLKVSGQKALLKDFTLTGKALGRWNGQYVDVLGARLDHYPNVIQIKRIRQCYSKTFGFEWVVDGKRHFLGHEKESGKLTRQIFERFRWGMFLEPPGKSSEKEIIFLVEQHMNGTLTFMQELKGEKNINTSTEKARQYAWEAGYNGRDYSFRRVKNLLDLWEADFFGGKQRAEDDEERFRQLKAKISSEADWLENNWRCLDWRKFNELADEKGLQGESFGRFRNQIRNLVLIKGLDLRDTAKLEKEYYEFFKK